MLKLENELGAKLFQRAGRSVTLTSFGEAFLPKAVTILQQIHEAHDEIRDMIGGEGGRVALGVIPTIAPFFLPSLLADFLKQHPRVEVNVVEEPSAVLLDWVREGKLDLAIVPLPIRANWASFTELARESLFAVVCPEHPLQAEKQVTLKQLSDAPFLFLKDGHCFRDDVLARFRSARVKPRIAFESGCFLTILNMVKAGIGISVVPEMAVDWTSGCTFIPVISDRPVRVVGLVQSRLRTATRAQQALASLLKNSAKPGRSRDGVVARKKRPVQGLPLPPLNM